MSGGDTFPFHGYVKIKTETKSTFLNDPTDRLSECGKPVKAALDCVYGPYKIHRALLVGSDL